MKNLVSLMFCLTLLVVAARAQTFTSQTGEPYLELGRHMWGEAGFPGGTCDDCPGLPRAAQDYILNSRKYKYIALAELRNRSAKAIKSIDVDFVFIDAETKQEFLRYHVHSDKKIHPGQKKEIRRLVRDVEKENNNYSPARPTQDVLSRTDRSVLKLVVTRIEYVDGSVWRQP